MQFQDFARFLRRRWWLPLLGVVVGVLGGFALTKSATPTYSATSEVLITSASAKSPSDMALAGGYIDGRMKTYAGLATSPLILDRVNGDLRLGEGQGSTLGASAAPVADTALIDISVTGTSADRCAAIANDIAKQFSAALPQLEKAPGASPQVAVTVVHPALAPAQALSPNGTVNLASGAALGLAVSLTLTYVWAKMNAQTNKGAQDGRRPSPEESLQDGE